MSSAKSRTAKDLLPPEAARRYTELARIGEGGMGTVYRAQDLKLRRKVALKFVHAHMLTEEVRKRFLREARCLARLNHPNVVSLFDYCEEEGTAYLAMEYVRGTLMDELVVARALDVKEAVSIMVQVADGLQAAHEVGVLHRDIKPANVIVTNENVPKLMDFGLAKVTSGCVAPNLTQTGYLVGTPLYIPPEVWDGDSYDERGDVYQLGLVLYIALVGKPPEAAEAYAECRPDDATGAAVAPSAVGAASDARLDRIVLKAIRGDPTKRYQSAGAFCDALRRWLEGEPAVSGRAPERTPSRPRKKRRKRSRRAKKAATGRRMRIVAPLLVLAACLVAAAVHVRTSLLPFSYEDLRIEVEGPRASIRFRSRRSYPTLAQVEGGRADVSVASAGKAVTAHRIDLSGLELDRRYELRFAYPDGTRSLPVALDTGLRVAGFRYTAVGDWGVKVHWRTLAPATCKARLRQSGWPVRSVAATRGARGREHSLAIPGVTSPGGVWLTVVAEFGNLHFRAAEIHVGPGQALGARLGVSQAVRRIGRLARDERGAVSEAEPKLTTGECRFVLDVVERRRDGLARYLASTGEPYSGKARIYDELALCRILQPWAPTREFRARFAEVEEIYRSFAGPTSLTASVFHGRTKGARLLKAWPGALFFIPPGASTELEATVRSVTVPFLQRVTLTRGEVLPFPDPPAGSREGEFLVRLSHLTPDVVLRIVVDGGLHLFLFKELDRVAEAMGSGGFWGATMTKTRDIEEVHRPRFWALGFSTDALTAKEHSLRIDVVPTSAKTKLMPAIRSVHLAFYQ